MTAAVEYAPDPALSGPTYSLRFRVELIHPYVIELTQPVPVPREMRVRLEAGDLSVFEDLKALAVRS